MSEEWLSANIWWIAIASLWELGWKGWALWRSARNNDKAWFGVLLLVNTLGVLPMAYLFIFGKQNQSKKVSTT